MVKNPQYLLDANVLMEAKRRYYRFGLCPGFWVCLVWQYKQGSLLSIDRIKDEIEQGNDDLTEWVKQSAPKGFFVSTTNTEVAKRFGEMVAWVQTQAQYLARSKGRIRCRE